MKIKTGDTFRAMQRNAEEFMYANPKFPTTLANFSFLANEIDKIKQQLEKQDQ